MKKFVVFGIVALVLLGGSVFAFITQQGAAPVEAAEILAPVRSATVVAEGAVVPVRNVALSPQTSGQIAEVLVGEGEQVNAGQVIVRLEAARQQAALAQAEAGLARAEAHLAELKAGALPQEIAAAEAAVDAAQAQTARLDEGAKTEDIRAAEAALASAQASLAKVLEGASEPQLINARAELANAEAAIRQAQAAYDRVKWDANIGARPESVQLEQATNAYTAAQARLADLTRGASQADLDGERARVSQAQAQLDALMAAARPADRAAAEAEIRRANAQLELVRGGARTETVAAARADVLAAQAALSQAQAALAETEVLAPFAGTIAELDAAPGQQVSPGFAVVQLADLSAWQIETSDLTELDIVNVTVGDKVEITFDALPDETPQGEVIQINDIGRDNRGEISYTVTIRPDTLDERLRWNMTAAVRFGVGK